MSQKTCCTCKQLKPLESFIKNATRKDGRTGYCKDCYRVRDQKRYEKKRAVKRHSSKMKVITWLEYRELMKSSK